MCLQQHYARQARAKKLECKSVVEDQAETQEAAETCHEESAAASTFPDSEIY